MPLISEIIWNKNDLLKNNIKRKFMNVEVMKYYYLLFSKDGLIKNFVSYIILSIIFINIVFAVLFCIKGYDKLNLEIKKIILNKKNTNEIKESDRENNDQKKMKKKNQLPPLQNQINRRKINTKNMNYNENEISSKLDFKLNNNGGVTDIKIYPNLQSKNNKIIFNNQELNNLEYKEAKQYDKRNFFQFYISLLKTNYIIIFIFFQNNDYNSRYIKINLFLFSFTLYFTVNGLFFTESTMHKIYKDGGRYNFIYHIRLAIYSSLI